MVNEALLGIGRDDDQWDAAAVAPDAIVVRRRNVVPAAAVLVVSDKDGCMGPIGAVLDGVDDVGHVLLASEQVGVAGVLVVWAERLDKADSGKIANVEIVEEINFVLQVRRRQRVPLPVGQPGGEVVVV